MSTPWTQDPLWVLGNFKFRPELKFCVMSSKQVNNVAPDVYNANIVYIVYNVNNVAPDAKI